MVGVAVQLGIDSLRAPLLALAAARAAAALDERDAIGPEDAALAARLVFGARATRLPPMEEPPPPDQPDEDEPEPPDQGEEEDADVQPLEDLMLEAAKAAIPAGLLAQLKMFGGRQRQRSSGKAGELHQSKLRGRPIGSRRGDPRAGVRINVVETLRSAAPWQRLRRGEAGEPVPVTGKGKGAPVRPQPRVEVRRDDFRVTRYKHRSETTTIFVVDASGSTALNRLAEAKGAVELLLADCYVRRDQVAMLAFRGKEAELLLPPTRSLFRAKKCLAALPGGGGTPLAAGIISAALLAEDIRRRGQTPTIVFLTDGRGNIARDGSARPPQGRGGCAGRRQAGAQRQPHRAPGRQLPARRAAGEEARRRDGGDVLSRCPMPMPAPSPPRCARPCCRPSATGRRRDEQAGVEQRRARLAEPFGQPFRPRRRHRLARPGDGRRAGAAAAARHRCGDP